MEFKTKEQLLIAVNNCLPYSNQMTDLDFTSEENAIRFTWRKTNKFRISLNGGVEEVGEGVLIGSDLSILLDALLKNEFCKSL